MISLQNICPRCLIEASGADFNLTEYMERVEPELRTPEDLYSERLKICQECERLNAGLCRGCGCFVELRAYTATNHCPYDKW